MRKLNVSTLVTLDGVIQDPGGFGETDQGGWGNPYFTEDAQQDAYEHLMASDYFLCGRVTYELLFKTWAKIKGGPYLDRMNSIPKLVASRTLTEPLEWNATLIKGDVAEEIARLKQEPGKDIEMYGSAALATGTLGQAVEMYCRSDMPAVKVYATLPQFVAASMGIGLRDVVVRGGTSHQRSGIEKHGSPGRT